MPWLDCGLAAGRTQLGGFLLYRFPLGGLRACLFYTRLSTRFFRREIPPHGFEVMLDPTTAIAGGLAGRNLGVDEQYLRPFALGVNAQFETGIRIAFGELRRAPGLD